MYSLNVPTKKQKIARLTTTTTATVVDKKKENKTAKSAIFHFKIVIKPLHKLIYQFNTYTKKTHILIDYLICKTNR